MADEPEVIKQQMEETRASLTEKLETLEHQVVATVQNATSAVTETVDTVKEAVQETVGTVKESMHETVETVKDTFDLERQVARHPWAMMAGAVAVGYLGGYLINRAQAGNTRGLAPGYVYGTGYWPPEMQPRRDGPPASEALTEAGPAGEFRPAKEKAAEGPGWLSSLTEQFQPEIQQIKGLAIGTLLGVVRDMLTRSVPPTLEAQVGDVVNSLTTKLGGKPLRGPILPEPTSPSTVKGEEYEHRYGTEMGRPLGPAERQGQAALGQVDRR